MYAKRVDNKPYNSEDKEADLETFKDQFEKITSPIYNPKAEDNCG